MKTQEYRAEQRSQLTTIRARVEHDAEEHTSQAATNQHDSCIHTLYANPDGHLYWGCEASTSTWNSYDGDINHPTAQLWQGGTGSCSCPCDLCAAGIDADDDPDYGEQLYTICESISGALDRVPVGYFDDEEPEESDEDRYRAYAKRMTLEAM